jgi:hypothetical protein
MILVWSSVGGRLGVGIRTEVRFVSRFGKWVGLRSIVEFNVVYCEVCGDLISGECDLRRGKGLE